MTTSTLENHTATPEPPAMGVPPQATGSVIIHGMARLTMIEYECQEHGTTAWVRPSLVARAEEVIHWRGNEKTLRTKLHLGLGSTNITVEEPPSVVARLFAEAESSRNRNSTQQA